MTSGGNSFSDFLEKRLTGQNVAWM